jgi:hypothetical protein
MMSTLAPCSLLRAYLAMQPNNAFESGRADKHRAFSSRPWRRATQRKR